MEEVIPARAKQTRKFVKSDERRAIYLYLAHKSNNEKRLPSDILDEAAAHFEVNKQAVSKIWRLRKNMVQTQQRCLKHCHQRKGFVEVKREYLHTKK